MKLLAWNVQQGGAARAAAIVEFIDGQSPDVLILSEVRPTSGPLLDDLARRGWTEQLTGLDDCDVACVALLARTPLVRLDSPPPTPLVRGRFIEAWSPSHNAVIAGVYGPLQKEGHGTFWTGVRGKLHHRIAGDYVLGGDLNTGESLIDAPNEKFFCSEHFVAMRDAGLVDLFRQAHKDRREYSYHHRDTGGTRGPGFRIDHLLASPTLAKRLETVEYHREPLEAKTSDHAPVTARFGGRR